MGPNASLGGGLLHTDRATYFGAKLVMGWHELLCCPSAMGCRIMYFDQENPNAGEVFYKIRQKLSHNEHVPRFQLMIVSEGRTTPWVVGYLERTESHLRSKPGEFFGANVWQLTVNGMVETERPPENKRRNLCLKERHKTRVIPDQNNVKKMTLVVATQAKIGRSRGLDASVRDVGGDDETLGPYDRRTERWSQTVSVEDPLYKVSVAPPAVAKSVSGKDRSHTFQASMDVLRIMYAGKKVCVARKQQFAGTLGKVCQPFLGVQIKPSNTPKTGKAEETINGLLDVSGLALLAMSLAWSQETMSADQATTRMFVNAMRLRPHEYQSAAFHGLNTQWSTEDLGSLFSRYPYYKCFTWANGAAAAEPDSDAEDDPTMARDGINGQMSAASRRTPTRNASDLSLLSLPTQRTGEFTLEYTEAEG